MKYGLLHSQRSGKRWTTDRHHTLEGLQKKINKKQFLTKCEHSYMLEMNLTLLDQQCWSDTITTVVSRFKGTHL